MCLKILLTPSIVYFYRSPSKKTTTRAYRAKKPKRQQPSQTTTSTALTVPYRTPSSRMCNRTTATTPRYHPQPLPRTTANQPPPPLASLRTDASTPVSSWKSSSTPPYPSSLNTWPSKRRAALTSIWSTCSSSHIAPSPTRPRPFAWSSAATNRCCLLR